MRIPRLVWVGSIVALGIAAQCQAHFHMLLPQSPACKRGETVDLSYLWGHPFEHQLFNASAPKRLLVRCPSGKTIDLLPELTIDAQQIKAQAYITRFSPTERGDFVFFAESQPILLAEDREFVHDFVKVILHVQAQKGWDAAINEPMEMLPLTRPYGLRAGMVFRAQVMAEGKALAAASVEIERFNASAPNELPAEEHITYAVKTDPNGVAAATLTEPGWWCLAAARRHGEKEADGKRLPVRQRAILWVYVDDSPANKSK